MIPRSKHVVAAAVAVLFVATSVSGQAQGRGGGQATPRSGAAMSAGTGVGAMALEPEYRIGAEDILDVIVMTHADLDMRGIQVRPDGRISLPLVNDIAAAGLTPMELRAAIIKALNPYWKDQEVSVTVREVRSSRFSVVGAVKQPNLYALRSQLTVLEAIAMAGGVLTDFAHPDRIYVQRADGTRLPFNYNKFMSDPNAQPNFLLKHGDIVVVP